MGPIGRHQQGLQRGVRDEATQKSAALRRYIGYRLKAFRVLTWERRFFDAFTASSDDVNLSIPRANGKSAIASALACCVVDPDGPLHADGDEVTVVASSHRQAGVVFEDALRLMRRKTGLSRNEWRVQDTMNASLLEHRATGSRLRCIGSDPRRQHGLRSRWIIGDEIASWDPAKVESSLSALSTSLGKREDSRRILIGTRPADGDHPFARALADPDSLNVIYAADPEDDPLSWTTVRKANPSLGALASLRKRLRREMALAGRDSSALSSWRALRLNMGVPDTDVCNHVLTAEAWRAIEGDAAPVGPCFWGADTAEGTSMCAIACYWPDTGRLEVVSCFPSIPNLRERGLRDGCARLYLDCHERGELLTLGARAPDLRALVVEALRRFGRPVRVVADRHRLTLLQDAIASVMPNVPLLSRGMGFIDGAAHIRVFRRAALEGRVHPVESLLLRSAASSARVIVDAAGNSKLAKSSQGGRRTRSKDDALAACLLAVWAGISTPATSVGSTYSGIMAGSAG